MMPVYKLQVLTMCLLLASAGTITAGEDGKRILIAGDSTASSYPAERAPQTGWGQALPYFIADDIEVLNRAVSGRSTRSYIGEGKWQALVEELRTGDIVLVSFGHNDSRDDAPERYAPADGAYRENLLGFIIDVRSKGAVPIVVSPAARRLWEGPAMVETHGLYALNARLAAEQSSAPFIDLSNLSIAYFETLGREETKRDFLWLTPDDANTRFPDGVEDNTHFSELGACGVARLVATALAKIDTSKDRIDATAFAQDGIDGARPPSVVACAAAIQRD